jgi:hypothetical protein
MTSTPTSTPTVTPTPLPYAHDVEKELRPICGFLSWPEVRQVFPEEMKVVAAGFLRDNWQSIYEKPECEIYHAIPVDENGNPTAGAGFIFYTLKDEPDTGINSMAVDYTLEYVKWNEDIGAIWSVQEADQMWK